MRVAVYSTKPYDHHSRRKANNAHRHDLTFFEARLPRHTAALADGFDAICAFVNDDLSEPVVARVAKLSGLLGFDLQGRTVGVIGTGTTPRSRRGRPTSSSTGCSRNRTSSRCTRR